MGSHHRSTMSLVLSLHVLHSFDCLADIACAKQIFPSGRTSRRIGPGVEMRDEYASTQRANGDLDDLTALE